MGSYSYGTKRGGEYEFISRYDIGEKRFYLVKTIFK